MTLIGKWRMFCQTTSGRGWLLRRTVFVEEDVGRLEIAVHDNAALSAMTLQQRRCQLAKDALHKGLVKRAPLAGWWREKERKRKEKKKKTTKKVRKKGYLWNVETRTTHTGIEGCLSVVQSACFLYE